jgi:hypothetical protein
MGARATPMTENQRICLSLARDAQRRLRETEDELALAVKAARERGLPLLTLANALGVSRSRIRRLAR